MERQKAVLASSAIAGLVVLGAIGFAASGALGSSASDNVGKLQPTPTVTVVIDPATGAATAQAAPAAAPATGGATGSGEHEVAGTRRSHEVEDDHDD